MTITYQCETVSESGSTIGIIAGMAGFIGLAYLGYAIGAGWLAILGFPLILIGLLTAQRRSTYELRDDGVQVIDVPARSWAFLSDPGERFVAFGAISKARVRLGKGRIVGNLIFHAKTGRRFAVTEDRLQGMYPQWRAFTLAFVEQAARHGLTVSNAEGL